MQLFLHFPYKQIWQWIYWWLPSYKSLLAYVATQEVKYPLLEDFNLHIPKARSSTQTIKQMWQQPPFILPRNLFYAQNLDE